MSSAFLWFYRISEVLSDQHPAQINLVYWCIRKEKRKSSNCWSWISVISWNRLSSLIHFLIPFSAVVRPSGGELCCTFCDLLRLSCYKVPNTEWAVGCAACIPAVGEGRRVFYCCLYRCVSVSPSGSELVSELDSSQSRVVQPAAGFSVVPVGTARQLPAPPHLSTRAKWQVTSTQPCREWGQLYKWDVHTPLT